VSTDLDEETPELAAFRAEAHAFLAAHFEPRPTVGIYGTTLGDTDTSKAAEDRHVAASRDYQRLLADNGWAGLTWPVEYGGRGLTPKHQRTWLQEEAKFKITIGFFSVASQMVAPTIMTHGTEAQKEFFLPRILRGEHIWCQLFSEPGAGSDLAGLATRATRDGEEFLINGQKVWNSGAHFADFGILLARTDWDVPKHKGISYFLVDMHSPGIDVRPLKQITGFSHFNETFMTDVRIPADNLLGGLNNGWAVAHTTLTHERTMIGGGGTGLGFKALLNLARECGVTDDQHMRQQLAHCYTRFELLRMLGLRARANAKKGASGPESSVMKLAISNRVRADGDLVLAMQGPRAMLHYADARDGGMWQNLFLNQWSIRIGGGTEQVQRNVMGERVLGLPGDIRVDKDRPFKDLPRN
jgi:alkylation response protein AidB-like acyl-CoA dehydrogenase